jgi:hypothetical protein
MLHLVGSKYQGPISPRGLVEGRCTSITMVLVIHANFDKRWDDIRYIVKYALIC